MNEGYLSHNGATIWYRRAGHSAGRPVLYLHGGPGYSSYSFEHSAGVQLESRLNMIYMDQRDCGRSRPVSADAPLTVSALVEDIEALRRHLGLEKIDLIGHSFGGLVAVEYYRAYPANAGKMILIEITGDLPAMIEHQLSYAASAALRIFPESQKEIQRILEGTSAPLEKLYQINVTHSWKQLQREIFWFSEEAMRQNTALDLQAGLFENPSRLPAKLNASGYMESRHEELMRPLDIPAILFSGRHSQCVGADNLQKAAAQWKIPLNWFEYSGHLPYAEEPEAFARATFEFLCD